MTVQDWKPVLVENNVKVLYEEWDGARRDWAVRVLSFVVMPEHVHLILSAEKGQNITRFLGRVFSLTSRRIINGPGLWKEKPRLLPLNSSSILKTKVDYLHRNPLRRGFVANPEDWEHSSFRQLVFRQSDVAFVCDSWDGLLIP